MSTEAQINTLKKQIKSGKLVTDKGIIREYLKARDGMSSRDLEQTLGMLHETFSGRLSELVTSGEVYYHGTQLEFHSEHSKIYYEHSKEMQVLRAKRIKRKRFKQKVKSLLNNYDSFISEEDQETFKKYVI